jgi:hypothetical protein
MNNDAERTEIRLIKIYENPFLHSRHHVTVPPRWVLEPRDRNVTRDESVVFHCQAEGFPTPTLTWRKVIGEKPFIFLLWNFSRSSDKSRLRFRISLPSLMSA